jgi:hydroxymethylpyrimidine/phosphomethylpyrimidine kinase
VPERAVTEARAKVALTIAGSDPTGGAGIQGDLRTFAAHGVHGLSVISCVTVQGTRGVRAVHALDAALVRAQIEVVLGDVEASVIKLGALADAAIVETVAEALEARPDVPLVADTVIASTSGAPLLDAAGVRAFCARLLPRATIVTPNAHELGVLAGFSRAIDCEALLLKGAQALIALGARAVLAKGGHLPGAPIDLLVTRERVVRLEGTRIESACTHGTGCTLASAIAANLALGRPLEEAAVRAKRYVEAAIAAARPIGPGKSPLAHFAPRVD